MATSAASDAAAPTAGKADGDGDDVGAAGRCPICLEPYKDRAVLSHCFRTVAAPLQQRRTGGRADLRPASYLFGGAAPLARRILLLVHFQVGGAVAQLPPLQARVRVHHP